MAKEGDQPTDQQGGESKLRLDVPPQAFTQPPSRDREEDQSFNQHLPTSFGSTTRLGSTSTSTSWPQQQQQQQHPTALQPKARQPAPPPQALQQPAVQQPAVQQPALQQPVRRRITQKGPGPAATKLHNILEKARSQHELEVAVNAAEDELADAKEALKDVHLQAYYEDDLSLFAEDDIKKAMLKEGESLHGTYDPCFKGKLHKAAA